MDNIGNISNFLNNYMGITKSSLQRLPIGSGRKAALSPPH